MIAFLEENNVKYRQHKNVWFGHSDVFLPDTRVAIKIDGEVRKRFYETHKGKCYPVFIRDDESLKFILEKLQNTIVKSMMKEQKMLMREKQKEENRRINAEQMKLRAERKAAKAAMEARKATRKGGRR